MVDPPEADRWLMEDGNRKWSKGVVEFWSNGVLEKRRPKGRAK